MTLNMQESFCEPKPRAKPGHYEPFKWPRGEITQLEPAAAQINVDIVQVLQERQSRRLLDALPPSELGALLWLTCRTHSHRTSKFGFDQEFRPYPSAGAMHPIHVVCQRFPGMPWERYEPTLHALVGVPGTEALAQSAREKAASILPTNEAVLVGLVAEPGKTAAKYECAESLVWRDAGVLLGYLSLVTETLGLGFCPLGMTGDLYLAPISTAGQLHGVGLAVVGTKVR
jgi:SagB-type dehydrogenase family enzyme